MIEYNPQIHTRNKKCPIGHALKQIKGIHPLIEIYDKNCIECKKIKEESMVIDKLDNSENSKLSLSLPKGKDIVSLGVNSENSSHQEITQKATSPDATNGKRTKYQLGKGWLPGKRLNDWLNWNYKHNVKLKSVVVAKVGDQWINNARLFELKSLAEQLGYDVKERPQISSYRARISPRSRIGRKTYYLVLKQKSAQSEMPAGINRGEL